MTFALDISKIAKKYSESLDKTARIIKMKLFNGVIKDTRVDTGRLRGNWQTTTGKPASGTIERLDPEGTAATAEVKATVKGNTVDYLSNNLEYAEHWEEQDGMIAKNVQRIERTIKESIKG